MSVPPRQPRPNQPSTARGGTRNATTAATTASGPNTAGTRRTSVFQQDQDSGTAVVSSSSGINPFVSRRQGGGRPPEQQQQQRHGSNNNNNSTPSHRPATSRQPTAPPAPRPSHTASRLHIATPPPPAPRLAHAVARPVNERLLMMAEDDAFASRPIATPRGTEPRGLRRGRHGNLVFDSPDLNASPITPFDMMFTPNTQVIETAGVGVGIGMATTPVTARLAETFSSIAMSSAEGSPEGGSTSMTATRSFIKRPSRIVLAEDDEQDEAGDEIHPGDKALDDDDVESFLSKRESLIRGRRAIEKQPRRLQSHTGPHDMYYSSPSAGMATPEGFTTPQHRTVPPLLSAQLPTRTPAVAGPSRFQPSLLNRDDPDTPVGRNRDQTSEPSSLWTNAGRRAMLDLKRQYQRDSDGKEGAQEGTSRSIDTMDHDAAAASTSAEPERDPFLETPRPSGRDCVATEDQEQEEQEDDFDYDRDIILDDADLEQDFENTADTASISEGHDSLAEPSYESEELEKERRKKAAIIRANRSFELNMKAARQEAEAEVKAKMAAAEAADALVAQELLEASVEIEQEEEEVEESEDKILRRQLEAEMEEDLETFEESSFQELADSTHHLSSTADLLNELVQERNGRQLTTPEELECQSWMYEVGRVGKPQRVGVWARA